MHTVLFCDVHIIQNRIDLVVCIQVTLEFGIEWLAEAFYTCLTNFSLEDGRELERIGQVDGHPVMKCFGECSQKLGSTAALLPGTFLVNILFTFDPLFLVLDCQHFGQNVWVCTICQGRFLFFSVLSWTLTEAAYWTLPTLYFSLADPQYNVWLFSSRSHKIANTGSWGPKLASSSTCLALFITGRFAST